MSRPLRATAFLLLCMLATVGCSSDSIPVFVQPCLVFSPDENPGTVELRTNEDQTGCSILVVDVFVSNVENVFGAEFTFTYPVNIMEFDELSLLNLEDSFLNSDGLLLQAFADENDSGGEVTVVLTRDGSQTEEGVDAGDRSLLISLLFFQAAGSGGGDIDFVDDKGDDKADLLAPGEPPTPISDVNFTGGSILIQ